MKKGKYRWPGQICIVLILVFSLAAKSADGARTSSNFAKSTTTTTTTTEQPDEEADKSDDEVDPKDVVSQSTVPDQPPSSTKPTLTGIPQIDYIHDPNLPRELNGYNLTEYPFYEMVPPPETMSFKCDGLHDGFYASVPNKCQVYHNCLFGIRYDFLCANYTAFDQKNFICHWVSQVDCENSPKYFSKNDALYKSAADLEAEKASATFENKAELVEARAKVLSNRRPDRNWRIHNQNQNDALYQAASTTTLVPPLAGTMTGIAANNDRPATPENDNGGRVGAGGGRRRPGYRRRRPQYDYYAYDDEYDDDEFEYEDSRRPYRRRQRPRHYKRPLYDDYEDERYDRRAPSRSHTKPIDDYDDRRSNSRHRPSSRRPAYEDRKPAIEDRYPDEDRRGYSGSRRPVDDDRRSSDEGDRRPADDVKSDEEEETNERRPSYQDRRTRPSGPADDEKSDGEEEKNERRPSYQDRRTRPSGSGHGDRQQTKTRRPYYNEDRAKTERNESKPSAGKQLSSTKEVKEVEISQEESGRDEARSFPSSAPSRNQESTEGLAKPAGLSIYNKPRMPPKIRRPVPLNARVKYDYSTTTTTKPLISSTSASKVPEEEYYDEYETEDPKQPTSESKTSTVSRSKPKQEEVREKEEVRPKVEESRQKLEEIKPRLEEMRTKTEEVRPKLEYARRQPSRIRGPPKRPVPVESYEDESFEELPKSTRPAPKIPLIKPTPESEEISDDETPSSPAPLPNLEQPAPKQEERGHYIVSSYPPAQTEDSKDLKDPEPTAPAKEPPQTYVRVAKRPFLPSRGGSPYLPRGLKPVGGKTQVQPTTTTTSTTTEAAYVEYDYDVEDPKATRPVQEDAQSDVEYDYVTQTKKDNDQTEFVDPYTSLKTATADYKEPVPVTALSSSNFPLKNQDFHVGQEPESQPAKEKEKLFKDVVFKPSPQISESYVPTSRPYTAKIPENISFKQNIADPIDKDYDATLNDALSPTIANLPLIRNYPSGFVMQNDRDYTFSRFRNQPQHYSDTNQPAASEHSVSYHQARLQEGDSIQARLAHPSSVNPGDYLIESHHSPVTRSAQSYFVPQQRNSGYGDDVVSRIRIRPAHSYYEIAT